MASTNTRLAETRHVPSNRQEGHTTPRQTKKRLGVSQPTTPSSSSHGKQGQHSYVRSLKNLNTLNKHLNGGGLHRSWPKTSATACKYSREDNEISFPLYTSEFDLPPSSQVCVYLPSSFYLPPQCDGSHFCLSSRCLS